MLANIRQGAIGALASGAAAPALGTAAARLLALAGPAASRLMTTLTSSKLVLERHGNPAEVLRLEHEELSSQQLVGCIPASPAPPQLPPPPRFAPSLRPEGLTPANPAMPPTEPALHPPCPNPPCCCRCPLACRATMS